MSISDAQAEDVYAAIRRKRGDIAAISRNTGIPEHLLRSVRRHVFIEKHKIAVGPRQTITEHGFINIGMLGGIPPMIRGWKSYDSEVPVVTLDDITLDALDSAASSSQLDTARAV